jgi:hypothetical protein
MDIRSDFSAADPEILVNKTHGPLALFKRNLTSLTSHLPTTKSL